MYYSLFYELKENFPSNYGLTLYLPKGIYYYIFFVQGKRVIDYNNLPQLYRDGLRVNQLEVKRLTGVIPSI